MSSPIDLPVGRPLLLDRFLPAYRWRTLYATRIPAPADAAYDIMRSITLHDVPLARALVAIRYWPARLLGQGGIAPDPDRPLIDEFLRHGFMLLADDPPNEVVLGLVGKFWQFASGFLPLNAPEDFVAFQKPGYAKAAVNLLVTIDGIGHTCVSIETRVHTTDRSALRKFTAYWGAVKIGMLLVRLSLLGAIRRKALAASGRTG